MAAFEEQLAELEKVVERLEEGGLALDETVDLFENGMKLSKSCKSQLASAEARIQVLLAPEQGGPVRTEDVDMDVDEFADDDDEGYEEA